MKIITEPTVHLVSASRIEDAIGFLDSIGTEWTTTAGHTDAIPEIAGRLCYMSFNKPRPGGNAAYIKHILQEGHGSVLEHSTFGLIFQGVSRSLTHELVRHRAGMSYSQLSQRYVDESDTAFVVPPALEADVDNARNYMAYASYETARAALEGNPVHSWPKDWKPAPYSFSEGVGLRWIASNESSIRDYMYLVDAIATQLPTTTDTTARRKAAREAARSVLPNCTETKIFVTGNGRSWRHFLEMRGSLGADAEIRRLALTVLPVLRGVSPVLFSDYEVRTSEDGIQYIHTDYRKV